VTPCRTRRADRVAATFSPGLEDAKAAGRLARNHARVIDLPHVFAVALMILTIALFAAMIWAGNHEH
jgi:hypothetical protein